MKIIWFLPAWMGILMMRLPVQGADSRGAPPQALKDPQFTGFFRRTNGWIAGDVATTVPLSDGRVLWLFGDSFLDCYDAKTGTIPCLFRAHNAALIQDKANPWHPRTLPHSGSSDQSLFRPPEAKPGGFSPWFWPGAGFQDGRTVYVHLTELRQTPQGGMWGFKDIGQYWGRLTFPELKVAGYGKLPAFNGIAFGHGFVSSAKSGFTWAFGVKRSFIAGDIYVARFRTKDPAGRWSFWDGRGWSARAKNAAVVAHGASTSVNVCKVKDTFLLVTSEFSVACDQGRRIYVSVSHAATGPFSPLKKIFTVDDAVQGHHPFFYSPVAHPEFVNAGGLLITYCINGYAPCLPFCVNGRANPDDYRPRAIRLPLKEILSGR